MNYLTTYYKNLSEQLQEKLNSLQQNLQEAYVLNPSQISSERMGARHPFRQRGDTIARGANRANVLGAMMSARDYEGVNDHERAAIAAIIADTQQSAPFRPSTGPIGTDHIEYQGMTTFRPGPRTSGTQATGEHLRTALGAMRRLQNDPQFAQHHTNMMAGQLPNTLMQRRDAEAALSDEPYYGRTSDSDAKYDRRAQRNAVGLTPSTSVSDISREYGARMQAGPYRDPQQSQHEYPAFVPIDTVTRMGREFASNQRNQTSADEYQKARAKHLKNNTYES